MATKIKCVNKVKDKHGVIKVYQLIDENGNKIEATASQIKEEIRSGRYDFLNLQIDKAGRLVDKKTEAVAKQAKVKNGMSLEKQAEIFIKFVKEVRYKGYGYELIDTKLEDKIIEQCEKRFPDKLFRIDENKYRNTYTGKMDYERLGRAQSKVYENGLLANYIYGNLKSVRVVIADDWYHRHETDLVMSGEYTLEEAEELIEEENEEYKISVEQVRNIIKQYEKNYNMYLNYEIDDDLNITGVRFK